MNNHVAIYTKTGLNLDIIANLSRKKKDLGNNQRPASLPQLTHRTTLTISIFLMFLIISEAKLNSKLTQIGISYSIDKYSTDVSQF